MKKFIVLELIILSLLFFHRYFFNATNIAPRK